MESIVSLEMMSLECFLVEKIVISFKYPEKYNKNDNGK